MSENAEKCPSQIPEAKDDVSSCLVLTDSPKL